MKAHELAEILLRHPEYAVEVELPETVEDVLRVEIDCFEEEVGMVFLIVPGGADED